MLISVSLKYWDDDSYPVKGKRELVGSVWSTKGGFGKKKENEAWRWNQASARTDHLAAVSIPSPLARSRQPHHWEHQRSDERWQILIKTSDHVCSKACNLTSFFSPSLTDVNQCQDVHDVSASGFSNIGRIIEKMWFNLIHQFTKGSDF